MASERGVKEYLVESDFLFGLRKGDRHNPAVFRALEKLRRKMLSLTISTSATLEVRSVLWSMGLRRERVEDVVAYMDAKLADYDLETYSGLTLSDIVLAERLMIEHSSLGFFDSLHASIAKRLGVTVLSSDKIYESVNIPYHELDKV